jgi:nitroimidazol reductase NimA-like FMN-containing flavoprotein (pyridoxamine 5'-phosphate oxidase superfamily)
MAQALIDANAYMTLATADESGVPWASPVWFAHEGYSDFIWVSRPQARHSRNIAARPQVGIVIFDSTVPIGTGRAVYLEATAEQVPPEATEAALATFSRRSLEQGGTHWSVGDVGAEARHRLYRARPVAAYLLNERDERIPVELERR